MFLCDGQGAGRQAFLYYQLISRTNSSKMANSAKLGQTVSVCTVTCSLPVLAVLQIRRGNRDDLGIISHTFP